MIYVTCGHEKGIGLEVFVKSYLLLSKSQQNNIILFCAKETLTELSSILHIPIIIDGSTATIGADSLQCSFIEEDPYSNAALNKALETIKAKDVLVTLPTSKDQLIINGNKPAGHTEFFREYYNCDVCMFFKSNDANMLLITDHIPLNEVSQQLTTELIISKITCCVDNYKKYFSKFSKVVISGINPHAGEKGILGKEDERIEEAIIKLKAKFPKIEISGPLPGDSLFINNKYESNTLFVFMYHDQGLGIFKSQFKTIGCNISLGLPFLRLSVDHGTAFDLYDKNCADYMGCFHVLKEALKVNARLENEQ